MARSTGSTAKKTPRERFLAQLRSRPCVAHAARAAGIDRKTAYNWRNEDEDFAAQWDSAIEDALDDAEKVAWDRGRTTSDTLLIFMLKAHRPEKYRERFQVDSRNLTLERLILDDSTTDGDGSSTD